MRYALYHEAKPTPKPSSSMLPALIKNAVQKKLLLFKKRKYAILVLKKMLFGQNHASGFGLFTISAFRDKFPKNIPKSSSLMGSFSHTTQAASTPTRHTRFTHYWRSHGNLEDRLKKPFKKFLRSVLSLFL